MSLTATRSLRALPGVLALVTASLVWTTTPAAAETAAETSADNRTFQTNLHAVKTAGGIGVVGAVRGPRVDWVGAAGVRSIDAARPARPGDTARVASVTKPMVSVLALQEVQAGRWTLQTTVGEVLPGLLPRHERVTLEELLSHRSGLPDYFAPLVGTVTSPEQYVAAFTRTYTDRRLVALALTQPWSFRPGSSFGYSNTNYVVVGMMLEKLNGSPIQRLLRNRVFKPAGMTSSTYQTGTFQGRAHITDYAVFDRPYNLDDTSMSAFSAAGSVESTPADLDRFWATLFGGGLLRPALVREMARPRTTTPIAYGLGIYAIEDPCPGPKGEVQALFGHDGASLGTETLSFVSADGQRQASVAWTGRQYVPAPTSPEAAATFLVDAFARTCPRPVPAPAPGDRPAVPTMPRTDAALLRPAAPVGLPKA